MNYLRFSGETKLVCRDGDTKHPFCSRSVFHQGTIAQANRDSPAWGENEIERYLAATPTIIARNEFDRSQNGNALAIAFCCEAPSLEAPGPGEENSRRDN